MSAVVADVLMPLALDTAYSYAVPDGLGLEEGDVVQVPLANREVAGVVWSMREGQGGNLKKVSGVIDAPNLSPKMRKFLDWIAWYTLAPKGSALAMGLKIPDADRQEVARVVNEGINVAAQPFRVHVRVLDMASLFTPGFEYRDSMDVDGEEKIVREADGIHLNAEGSKLAADRVLGAIRDDFGD